MYIETLTEAPSGSIGLGSDGMPNGSEAIGTVESLTRDITDDSDQVVEEDNYFNLVGVTYSPCTPQFSISGTATGTGTATTLVDTGLNTAGLYVGDSITLTGGSGGGLNATITAFNASSHTLTFSPGTAGSVSTNTSTTFTLGAASDDSAYGLYHATLYSYDADGNLARTLEPNGTIHRTVYDLWGDPVSQWVGTDDDSSGGWSPTNNTSPSNMSLVEVDAYDNGNAAAVPTLTTVSGGSGYRNYYFVSITWLDGQGDESAGSLPVLYLVPAGTELKVTPPTAPTGVVAYNVYVSYYEGLEELQNAQPIPVTTSSWTQPTGGSLVTGRLLNFSGTGDGNLTEVIQAPNDGSPDHVTQYLYDFQDRQIGEKDGVQPSEDTSTHRPIYFWTLDNLGEMTGSYQFDGDQIPLSDFAGGLSGLSSGDASRLRAQTLDDYDELGQLYEEEQFSVTPSGTNAGCVSAYSLNTFYWYDQDGNVVKSLSPGGLVEKYVYDGADRETVDYTTDGGGDAAPGCSGSLTDAQSVTGDIVLSQVETTYDASGNVVFMTDRERFDTDSSSATGALGTPTSGVLARDYYSANYYDLADRLTASVDFGTNGGTAITSRPSLSALPAGFLETAYAYDSAGNLSDTTDPRGIQTLDFYDMLGRVTQEVDGHTTDSPITSIDQATDYTYDGEDHVITMTAQMPGGTNQTTEYYYGGFGNNVNNNDLLQSIDYPDPTTGQPSWDIYTSYTYNDLGEQSEAEQVRDANNSFDFYTYDVLGRLTGTYDQNDSDPYIDTSASDVGYAYGTNGQLACATVYGWNSCVGQYVMNQVEEVYNGLGQLIGEYQSHSGAVNTSTTPEVQYSYASLSGSSSDGRPTGMTYPNGRQLDYVYNTGLDSNISRISGLSDHAGSGSGNLESYSYLGLDTIVRRTRGNGTQLTYAPTTVAGGDGGDQYTGLDRFGRVMDQDWINTSSGTAFDRIQYAYDADSNVLYQNNLVNSAYSELFSPDNGAAQNAQYDALNRLLGFARGTLSASHGTGTPLDTVSSPSATEGWTLDALGNWTSFTNGSTTQTRSFNARNEITSISGVSTPTYDADGNMVIDPNGDKYFYNEWNQITKVENSSGTLLESYEYDALGRRIAITNATTGVTTDLYYDGSNVIEERQSGMVTAQYVWGLGYVNDLVLRDDNTTSGSLGVSGSGLGRRIYVEQDANFDVTSLTDTSGNVLERFAYDAYGNMIVLTGTTTWTVVSDSLSWVYTWQGGRLDQVTGFVRFDAGGDGRDVNTALGVPMEQDPDGYLNGANLYQWEVSNPESLVDPSGMAPDPQWNVNMDEGLYNAWVQQWQNKIDDDWSSGSKSLAGDYNALEDFMKKMMTEARNRADYHWDRSSPPGSKNHRPCGDNMTQAQHKAAYNYWRKRANAIADSIIDLRNEAKMRGLSRAVVKSAAATAGTTPDPFRRIPNNLNEKLAMDEAQAGAGQKIMDNLNDPRYKGMEKWQHVHQNPDGTNTVVHYVRDPVTGNLMDFKFKEN
jgi:YD repeat-containing protein